MDLFLKGLGLRVVGSTLQLEISVFSNSMSSDCKLKDCRLELTAVEETLMEEDPLESCIVPPGKFKCCWVPMIAATPSGYPFLDHFPLGERDPFEFQWWVMTYQFESHCIRAYSYI